MKTSIIEVHDMLSVLTVDEVEKRFGEVPGVESATVNYAAGNATVRYDETLLEVAEIKVIVHQRGQQSADGSQSRDESEDKPEHKHAVEPTAEAARTSASTPKPAVPKAPTVGPVTVPAPAVAAANGQQNKAAQSAAPSATVAATPKPSPAAHALAAPVAAAPAVGGHQDHSAPDPKPLTPVAAAAKAAPLAPTAPAPATPAVEGAPDAKSSTLATDEPKADSWKVHAFSLATTLGVTYILCAIFDVLFPPFGLLAALAPASPLPISGSLLAFLTGFALFTIAGFMLGALHGIAWKFWSKRLR
jgi:copper chaperone CopZ